MDDTHPETAASRLDRVKAFLERMKPGSDQSKQLQSAYTAKPRLTAHEITSWEAANSVSLPHAYQLFLLEIGNGGTMPGSYCDFVLRPLKPESVDAKLREPFPITQDRLKQRMAQLHAEGRGDDSLFPELDEYWEEGVPPGCLWLGHYPSYDMLFLIVSGELHGMVWCAVDNGVPELDHQGNPFDFLSWFEVTLLDLTRSA